MPDLIIAVDGHASCGKSTLAKDIAHAMNYTYVDSGAMYRAVTLFLIRHNAISKEFLHSSELRSLLDHIHIHFEYDPDTGTSHTVLNDEPVDYELRSMEVNKLVSEVSTIKEVRNKLVELQQRIGKNKRIVMDGRDIGTVVFPDADIKIFLTASLETRAQRRYQELQEKGIPGTIKEIKQNLETRDYIDSHREESPLRKPDDAFVIDNSNLSRQQQLNKVLELINTRF
jgi:cytidylate kinase